MLTAEGIALRIAKASIFDMRRKPQASKSHEERKLEIPPTTTNNTLELYVYTPAACLQRSTSPYLNVVTTAGHLQSAEPLCLLHVATRAARLQISIPLHLHVHTPAAHIQSSDTSVPPPPRPYTCSTPAELPISIPLHLHVHTPAAHLQSSIPLLRQRLQRISRAPIPLFFLLHVPTPATRLQSSRSPYLYIYTPAAHLQSSIPLCVLHVPTPAARLQSSRSPYLYTSTSTRLRRISRPPGLHTSMPTRPYTASRPPGLLRQYLHVCTPTTHVPSSRSLEANTSTSPGSQYGARGTRSLATSY